MPIAPALSPTLSPPALVAQELAAPQAMVCRDGRWQELPVRELVPGDLVALKGGDVIPADCEASSDVWGGSRGRGSLTGAGQGLCSCLADSLWERDCRPWPGHGRAAPEQPPTLQRTHSHELSPSPPLSRPPTAPLVLCAAGGSGRAAQGGRILPHWRVAGGDPQARRQGEAARWESAGVAGEAGWTTR